MAANREETLRQFCDVTGADEDRSKFFLESSNWQLEVALSSFYEHGGNIDDAPANAAPTLASPQPMSESDLESPPGSPEKPKKKDVKKRTNTKFATLDSLHQDSSSDEEEGEAFYAGGSERSGQQIIGPGRGVTDIVNDMFKSVRERGAAVALDGESTSSGRGRGGGLFGGVGYRLGQTSDDHEEVTPPNTTKQDDGRNVRLRLYREGFTVDDGPLRHYMDPQNAEFLACIRRGEVPQELVGRGQVRLSLEDKRQEEAPRNVPKSQPFSGKGHLLGSPTPAIVGAAEPAPPAPAQDRTQHLRQAQLILATDDQKPTTTIQIRLADGSRVTGRFNESHTVDDLYQYVTRAEPQYEARPFILLTAYPSAELTEADRALTLKAANLLNSTVMQRLQ
ncbi:NSFL1 cofactor p47 [Leptidea sinapis]|uniref:NSFL1 cofactor p47 n=1 Tax=Leptidea sinapis TaxID=189913 RepID=UPI0021C2FBDA|nr:NSFL1 cofactor p47 [Leptidea sinapis]